MKKSEEGTLTICQRHLKRHRLSQLNTDRLAQKNNGKISPQLKNPNFFNKQKLTQQLYICTNRACKKSFIPQCSLCKNQHRDHAVAFNNLQEISQMLQKLIITPYTLPIKYLCQSVDIMKKIKLIKEFRRKINIIEAETLKQATVMIQCTQDLIHQYANCKEVTINLVDKIAHLEERIYDKQSQNSFADESFSSVGSLHRGFMKKETRNISKQFQEFVKNMPTHFSKVEFNLKKFIMEYGNPTLESKQKQRQKIIKKTKSKIDQVKDYSMKIIEVILGEQQEDSDIEEATLMLKKKQYKMFKEELNILEEVIDQQYQESSASEYDYKKPKNSTAATMKNRYSRNIDQGSQTDNSWVRDLQKSLNKAEKEAQRFRTQFVNLQSEMRKQINQLQRDKENLRNDVNNLTTRLQKQKIVMKKFYRKISQNSKVRNRLEIEKQELFTKIMELRNSNLFKTAIE